MRNLQNVPSASHVPLNLPSRQSVTISQLETSMPTADGSKCNYLDPPTNFLTPDHRTKRFNSNFGAMSSAAHQLAGRLR